MNNLLINILFSTYSPKNKFLVRDERDKLNWVDHCGTNDFVKSEIIVIMTLAIVVERKFIS